jgi:hypothetical protein
LANTSNEQLLEHCLQGEDWPSELLDRALAVDQGRAFLAIVVERLADLFDPRLGEVYRRLFTQVIERTAPELTARLRTPRENQAPRRADRVYVLSRVTLGADVAVSSVLIDAARRRYPDAEIFFAGPQKSYEMFQGDPRIRHFPAPYARGGSLADRLRASAALWFEDGIVIDPDSRLTQLGLISVCDEARYFFFYSRAIQGPGRLPDLAADWAKKIFEVDARPFVALPAPGGEAAEITVSLGVGENEAKRLGDAFERDLLQLLGGRSVLVDKGGSAEERTRVERALRPGMRAHEGSFASFAAEIARSKLFIGYDSAGGHVASACGVPVISIFSGAVSDRFIDRWRPLGQVIRAEEGSVLARVARLI